jgi:hypothetical protein
MNQKKEYHKLNFGCLKTSDLIRAYFSLSMVTEGGIVQKIKSNE